MEATRSPLYRLYRELECSCWYLHLHLLPYEWFHFIFHGRPFDEIRHHLHYINDSLRYEHETYRGNPPICPHLQNIWRWTEFCRPREVKVVIIGQDPYHGFKDDEDTGHRLLAADGNGFNIDKMYFSKYIRHKYLPYSLQSIVYTLAGPDGVLFYKHHGDGDLTSWCSQGVLMLDSALTTRGEEADAHKHFGWDYVTGLVVENLAGPLEPRKVFMFWGRPAREMFADSVDEGYHSVIFRCHPATRKPKFDRVEECECKCWSNPHMNCFDLANCFLSNLAEPCYIDWNILR